MRKPFKKGMWKHVVKVAIAATLVVICVQLFPNRSNNFRYHYAVGKQWGYEMLTADKDYPIYKTQEQLSAEREQAISNLAPYFDIQYEVRDAQLSKAKVFLAEQTLSDDYKNQLLKELTDVYNTGILSHRSLKYLQENKHSKLTIVDTTHTAKSLSINQIYTQKTAYEKIISLYSKGEIEHLGLQKFLVDNLVLDSVKTAQKTQEAYQSISETQGLISKGETVVDNGETVTEEIYRKLESIRRAMDDSKQQVSWITHIGNYCLVFGIILVFALYLLMFRPAIVSEMKSVIFFCCLIGLLVILTCLTLRYTQLSIYLIPFAWIPIIACAFYDSRTAFMLHLTTILIISLIVPAPYEFLVIQLLVGLITVNSLSEMTQRAQLARTALWIVLTYSLAYTAIYCVTTGSLAEISWQTYIYFLLNGLFVIFAYGLIYLYEKAFGFVSSMTLVELTNINSKLLLKLAEKAPGTFQHSLQVSNLAVEAAKAIGADTLWVRTGALYHDIGKIEHPEYFTENQQGQNPLLQMSHKEAAKCVLAHVTDGVKIAEKRHLPKIIITFIQTHHGTSLVRYFYNSYVNAHPDEEVDVKQFQYTGPKPQTKENAIVMMADAVEARSRSLSSYTEESISQMVEQMVTAQVSDGQFSETPLSFKDVEDIKRVFKEKLISINHHRIAYPDIKK